MYLYFSHPPLFSDVEEWYLLFAEYGHITLHFAGEGTDKKHDMGMPVSFLD